MSKEYKCKLCKVSFNANWKLNRHRNGVYGCKYDDVIPILVKTVKNNELVETNNIAPQLLIEQNINPIIESNTENKCNKCNAIFTLKHNLKRHIKNNKCKVKQIKTNIQQEQQPIPQQIQQPIPQQIINNNTINNNNNNIINNNNGIINNYITQVHINPFGLETTDFLSLDQKLEILASGNMACIKILKIAYNKRENKNFFKTNKKDSHITYIDQDYELNILEEQVFRKKIYGNGINLLYSIFLDCIHSLSGNERLIILNTISYIEKDMYAEIFINGLSNVKKEMNGELNQIIKKQTELNNTSIKNYANYFINNILQNKEHLKLSYNETDKTIRKKNNIYKQLNSSTYDINNIITKKLNLKDLATQLGLGGSHYKDTQFYKDLKIKEKEEENLLKEKKNIGLYKKYSAIKQIRDKKIKEVLSLEQEPLLLDRCEGEID